MAPPEFSNVDFFNLQLSVTNLDRALDDANSQKTVRKGARKSTEHKPLEGLRAIVEEDLSKVVNSPLRPARGSGYGCLPLEAVQPARRLHEMLLRIVGPGGDSAILDDVDTAADLHARLQALVAPIDPDHPFLKVEFEFDGNSDGGEAVGGDDDDDDDEKEQHQQQTSSAKGNGKQVAEQPSKKGNGKQAVGTRRAAAPVEGSRRSARIIAQRTQVLADQQDPYEDVGDAQPNEGGDDEGRDKNWEDSKDWEDSEDSESFW